jgi:probable phosphoglycerate mutase
MSPSIGIKESPYQIFGQRHGQSIPNAIYLQGIDQQGIIISTPEKATRPDTGLTRLGREQVANNVKKALEEGLLDHDTLIISSDYSRAVQTAQIAQELLHTRPPIYTSMLRERFFGELEGKSARNYQLVWEEDEKNPDHHCFGVESVNEVFQRTLGLINGILNQCMVEEKKILLSSHGDPLQILETGLRLMPPGKHRQLPPLQQAEIRRYF